MNLLKFKNRFRPEAFVPTNVYEITGYIAAMQDWLEYLKQKTEFNPAKRMLDSIEMCDTINETILALTVASENAGKELSGQKYIGVDYASEKVKDFLKGKADDIPSSLFNQVENEIEEDKRRTNDGK